MLAWHLAAAFDMYVETVRERIHRRDLIKRVLCRMQHMQLARAFDQYSDIVARILAGRATVTKVISRMRMAKLVFAFEYWLECVEQHRSEIQEEGRELVKEEIARELTAERDKIHSEINQHKEAAARAAQRRLEVCQTMVKRMLAAHLLAAFNSFAETVWERIHRRDLVNRVLRRIQHMQVAGAFDRYFEVVQKEIARKSVVTKVITRMKKVTMCLAFDNWTEFKNLCKQEIEAAGTELAKQQMSATALLPLWSPWQLKLVLGKAQHLPKMDMLGTADPYVLLSHGKHEHKSSVIKSTYNPEWNEEFVFEIQSQNDEREDIILTIMDKNKIAKDSAIGEIRIAVASLSGKSISRTLGITAPVHISAGSSWRKPDHNFGPAGTPVLGKDKKQAIVTLSMKASNVPPEASIEFMQKTTAIELSFNNKNTQDDLAEDQAKVLLQQMLKVERDRNKANSDKVQAALAREIERRMEVCQRIVKRMLAWHLAAAFDMYVETVRERIHRRDLIKRVLCRMQHMQLARAFDQYSDIVARILAGRATVTKVISRMRMAKLVFAFEYWLECVEQHRSEIQEEGRELVKEEIARELTAERDKIHSEINQHKEAAARAAQRRLEVCQTMVKRMLAAHLLAAFNSFAETVWERIHRRDLVNRVLRRIQHMQVAGAFDRYLGSVQTTLKSRDACSRVVKQVLHVRLGVSFARWLDHAKDFKIADAQEGLVLARQELADEITADRENMKLERDAIVQQEKGRRMETCRRVMRHIIKAQLFKAWGGYLQIVVLRKQRRELIYRVVQKIYHAALNAAFDGFDCAVLQSMAQRQAIGKAINRWCRPRLQLGFDLFVLHLELRRAELIEEDYERARRAIKNESESNTSEMQRELQSAEELLKIEQERRNKICRSTLRRILQTNLSKSFYSFRHRVLQCKDRRVLCTRVVRRMLQAQLVAAFDGLHNAAQRTKRNRTAVLRVISRSRFKSLSKAFDKLRAFVADIQAERENEAWLQKQNELLTDVLAGTSIGKVLTERTLQDYALSEAVKEKRALMVMIVKQESKLANLERQLTSLEVMFIFAIYSLWQRHVCDTHSVHVITVYTYFDLILTYLYGCWSQSLLASTSPDVYSHLRADDDHLNHPSPVDVSESNTYRQEVVWRCRKLLSSALNLPNFDSALPGSILSAMPFSSLTEMSELPRQSQFPSPLTDHITTNNHSPAVFQVPPASMHVCIT